MEEKYKVYDISKNKNKSQVSKDIQAIRKEWIESNHKICQKCLKEKGHTFLELDHIIPISIGGKIFSHSNLMLLCHICHREKTFIDNSTVALIKKIGFIKSSKGNILSFVEPKRLIEIYLELRKLREEGIKYDKAYREWNYHTEPYYENRTNE